VCDSTHGSPDACIVIVTGRVRSYIEREDEEDEDEEM